MARKTMNQAITVAVGVEMKNDPNVLVFSEEVGVNGGVFRATESIQAEFGEGRVMDTTLAESGIG
ncbi:alpha-ketoacid dehydrogenase subunit beta, partial [Bacillus paranthracis]|nr:alpha-ketoacid dehydrogenase subunit beta [Bacillus paranthracis]